ncbi:hypothetical protein [Cardinium endosymbiont of Oedothorax gibbosus]|nr:hypothetical protein [Cardinium endosymbiont of Oedothorax gibbosus]
MFHIDFKFIKRVSVQPSGHTTQKQAKNSVQIPFIKKNRIHHS